MRKVTSILAIAAVAVSLGFLAQAIAVSTVAEPVTLTPSTQLTDLGVKEDGTKTNESAAKADDVRRLRQEMIFESITSNSILFLLGMISGVTMLFSERSKWMRYVSITLLGAFLFSYASIVIFGGHASLSEWVLTRTEALQVSIRMGFWSLAISEIHRLLAGLVFTISLFWLLISNLAPKRRQN